MQRSKMVRLIPLILILAAGCLYQAIVHSFIPGVGEVDPSSLQFLLYPLVLIGFATMRFGVRKLPRLLVVFAVLGVTVGSVGTYQLKAPEVENRLLTTRFHGDQFGSDTKRFRATLTRQFELEGSPPASHHHGQVTSQAEAAFLLGASPELEAVLWKADDRLMVTTREGMGEEENKFYREHLNFRKRVKRGEESNHAFVLVRDIPILSVPFKPRKESARFLATLFSGKQAASEADRETLLRAARDQESFWSGYEHRGYAALLLGNYYLDRALESGVFQEGDLSCAVESYDTGLGFVPDGKHPELRAALLNNKAVALASRGLLGGDDEELKRAKEHFHSGLQSARQRNRYLLDYRAAYIAGMNLQRLKRMRSTL